MGKPTLKIGGRELPVYYSTYELIAIERELGCTGFQIKDQVMGIRQTDEEDPSSIVFDVVDDPVRQEKLGVLITILCNAGLEMEGKKPDVTAKWVLRHMKPGLVLFYAMGVMTVIQEGNDMTAQEEEKENEGPVDVLLEEENAKKQQGG